MLTEQLTKHAVSRTSLESLRFVMFFETLLINLAKCCVSGLAVGELDIYGVGSYRVTTFMG